MRKHRKATEAANNKKTRKRKFVQNQGTLTMGKGSQLAPAEVVGEVENSEQSVKRACTEGIQKATRTCGICGQPGHDRRNCTIGTSNNLGPN
jgi:hypothetical protein